LAREQHLCKWGGAQKLLRRPICLCTTQTPKKGFPEAIFAAKFNRRILRQIFIPQRFALTDGFKNAGKSSGFVK
jgi:hypothetical protein